jgi:hypothetical protein
VRMVRRVRENERKNNVKKERENKWEGQVR